MVVVVFFSDSKPKILDDDSNVSFETQQMIKDNVTRIATCKDREDAKNAIKLFGRNGNKK